MGVLGVVGTAADTGIGYGRYETKRVWQYRVEFFPMISGSAIATLLTPDVQKSLTWAAKNVKRPVAKASEIIIKHGNESWKIAGKTDWASETCDIVFDDVIPAAKSGAGDTDVLYSASAIFNQWSSLIQDPTTGNAGLSVDYKSNIIITQFNPAGQEIERFMYYGAWPSNVNYGENWDYDNEDTGNRLTVTFSYDKFFKIAVGTSTPPTEVLGVQAEESL